MDEPSSPTEYQRLLRVGLAFSCTACYRDINSVRSLLLHVQDDPFTLSSPLQEQSFFSPQDFSTSRGGNLRGSVVAPDRRKVPTSGGQTTFSPRQCPDEKEESTQKSWIGLIKRCCSLTKRLELGQIPRKSQLQPIIHML